MRHMSSPAASVSDRMWEVVARLPPGPFSLRAFTDHATGLNAIDNERDVAPFLARLVEEGAVYRLGTNIAMWVLATDDSCCLVMNTP